MHIVASMPKTATRRCSFSLAAAALLGAMLAPAPGAHAFDFKRTEGGALVRWHTDTVTFAVRAEHGDFSLRELSHATDIALDAWRGMPGVPELVACPPAGSSRSCAADVTIEVPRTWVHDPGRLAVTLDTYEADTGALMSARVLVNPRYPTSVLDEEHPAGADYDLASTLAHELGHVLGLAESGFREATMWPNGGRGETFARTLDVDDEEAIATLYDAGDPALPLLYGCNTAPVVGAGPLAPAVFTLGLAALVVLARRRRLARAVVTARSRGRR